MFERRPILGLFIGLTVCVFIWRISVQEPAMLDAEFGYSSQYQSQAYYVDHSMQLQPTAYQKHLLARKSYEQQQSHQQIEQATTTTTGDSNKYNNKNNYYYYYYYMNNRNVPAPPPPHPSPIQLNISQAYKTFGLIESLLLNRSSFSFTTNNIIMATSSATGPSPLSSSSSSSSSAASAASSSLPAGSAPMMVYSALSTTFDGDSSVNVDALPSGDFSRLIDLTDFQFLMNQPACPRSSSRSHDPTLADASFALILVHSAPVNFKKRLLIRETWGSLESPHLRLIFLLGSVPTDELQQKIALENDIFSDMVQGNFVDAYKNMTYKHVMAFKWFIYYCPEADFLIKVDDDVFVNTMQLLEYIEEPLSPAAPSSSSSASSSPSLSSSPASPSSSLQAPQLKHSVVTSPITPRTYHVPSSSSSRISKIQNDININNNNNNNDKIEKISQTHKHNHHHHHHRRSRNNKNSILFRNMRNFLFCLERIGSRVKRSYRSKWRVSVKEYAGRYYPPYCPGYSIVYSPDVVFRLYIEAQRTKYFWIDDVHITGTLAQQANITITSFRPFVLDRDTCEDVLSGKTDLESLEFLFAWPEISEEQIRALWALNSQNFISSTEADNGENDNDAYRYDTLR